MTVDGTAAAGTHIGLDASVDAAPNAGPNAGLDTIHAAFARQAAARPDATAVVCGDERLTYGELDRAANELAHRLRALGVGPEVPVAVCLERSVHLVTALLAVLKAGGGYLPLDPTSPDDRLAFTLADAGARVLVTDRLTDRPGRELGAVRTVLTGAGSTDPASTDAGSTDHGSTDPGGIDPVGRSDTPPDDLGTGPASLAYVIYTSGSTGRPKGVMIEHRNVLGLLDSTRQRFGFGPDDVWSLFASAAFDVSVWEMWGALLNGGRLVVVPDPVRRAPDEFHALLRRERVTVLNQTPAAFRQLIRYEAGLPAASGSALRVVILAGEALPPGMLRPWIERHGDRAPLLVNMYGITETTVHSTYRRMTAADLDGASGSPIGEAISGWTLRVLDADGRTCAPGEAGELHVGGAGVARGYLGRPALTAERFLPDPDAATPGARRYRSGDSARLIPGAGHAYLGRLDHQVKIRGHRVEPGEIETALGTHPAVAEAVVRVDEDTAGEQRLVAYWVGAGGSGPSSSELREHLHRTLPAYMLPNVFVALDRLPLTANGKVDRRALPAPEAVRPELAEAFAAPGTPVEKAVADIWAEVLTVDQVGLDDDFFELGGHSLLATQVVAVTAERLGLDASLRLLFDAPTVREFAAGLNDRETAGLQDRETAGLNDRETAGFQDRDAATGQAAGTDPHGENV